MKKTWILLLVVAMVGALLAVPGTALAKGKPPESASGTLYDVTLAGALTTTTNCGSLVMRGTLRGKTLNLVADGENETSVPMLELNTSMTGKRSFPNESVTFSGCHGGSVWADSDEPAYEGGKLVDHPGLLMIAIDGDTITFQVWHFDYWREETSITHGKGPALDVDEHFRMRSGPITMTSCGENCGRVSGAFGIDHFLNNRHTGEFGYEPVTGSPKQLAFDITVTPAG